MLDEWTYLLLLSLKKIKSSTIDQTMDTIQMKSLHDTIHQVKQDLMTYFDTKVDPIFGTLSGMERSLST